MAPININTSQVDSAGAKAVAAGDSLLGLADVAKLLSGLGASFPGGHLEHSGGAAANAAAAQLKGLAERARSYGTNLSASAKNYDALDSSAASMLRLP